MAKSKNHTNHNQNAKDHKNGIKKPRRERYMTSRMVNQTLRRNIKRSRMFDPSIKKSATLQRKIQLRIDNKAKIQAVIKNAVMTKAMDPVKPKDKPPTTAPKVTTRK